MNHPFRPGTRVRHSGQRYWEAVRSGTATVVHYELQRDGTFEYWVLRDNPLLPDMDTATWWASYHTVPVRAQGEWDGG